jgi:type IV pilus biogenesis protein CpaD/CtpE
MITRPRSLVSVVAATALLAGCAHPGPIPEEAYPRAQDAEPSALQRVSNVCVDREWLCIVAGLAAFGGAVAVINSSD